MEANWDDNASFLSLNIHCYEKNLPKFQNVKNLQDRDALDARLFC